MTPVSSEPRNISVFRRLELPLSSSKDDWHLSEAFSCQPRRPFRWTDGLTRERLPLLVVRGVAHPDSFLPRGVPRTDDFHTRLALRPGCFLDRPSSPPV
jgi:hypothetical protein